MYLRNRIINACICKNVVARLDARIQSNVMRTFTLTTAAAIFEATKLAISRSQRRPDLVDHQKK